jgi:molybdopterin-guanine dinucleotide biosynthesis protein A
MFANMDAAAIVLAGGGSRRMGQDKAWLELDGQPLLARVIELLARRCTPIVVSARPGQSLPTFAGAETWRVDDPIADAGPLVGVLAALERLESHRVAVAYLCSCDAAGLSERHVDFMLERLRMNDGAIAAVPVDVDGRRHPLAAAIQVAVMRARAAAQLAAGDLRLQSLFRAPDVVEIPRAELPDPEVLAACNTPQEWDELLRRRAARR